MKDAEPTPAGSLRRAYLALIGCLIVLIASVIIAALVQGDFGRVEVSNVYFKNYNGLAVRAKLFRPREAEPRNRMPGVVYIHGYQNNRETSDPYCIELARRGVVVLELDAIGRGNSDVPGDPKAPDFDPSYGGRSALEYLRRLPYVRTEAIGLMGHSLGAEMTYSVALADRDVQALVISGYGYTDAATIDRPRNMLMIIGRWDEYRRRMTGVRDIEKEWMKTERTRRVFPAAEPRIGVTYGDFNQGTARRVVVPRAIHLQVSHSRTAVAEALDWIRAALKPAEKYWLDPQDQIWPIKEWATLAALAAGFFFLLPLGRLLLNINWFRPLYQPPSREYSCSGREYLRHAGVNAMLMWLYLPLIFALFGVHIYVIKIDRAFPMMLLNGLVWWFFMINLIGFFVWRRWYKRQVKAGVMNLAEAGLSYSGARLEFSGGMIKTILLALILFGCAYLAEHLLEAVFIVDWRFIFPFANDLTPYRALLYLIYLPFFILGFLQTGLFLHGQLRRPWKETQWRTFWSWCLSNALALIGPLVIFLAVQYVPLLTTGAIPFFGPGGMLANYVMTLFHVIGVLLLAVPISTWFFLLTGRVYLGAFLNALVVTWMLVSSQVIAPIPV
ncbi:MAG: alpha/beta fold hydrolase [Thermodesulfobacteriota bacterium]